MDLSEITDKLFRSGLGAFHVVFVVLLVLGIFCTLLHWCWALIGGRQSDRGLRGLLVTGGAPPHPAVFVWTARTRPKGRTVLLLGPIGAGKTTLFHRLHYGSTLNGTVASMEAREAAFGLRSDKVCSACGFLEKGGMASVGSLTGLPALSAGFLPRGPCRGHHRDASRSGQLSCPPKTGVRRRPSTSKPFPSAPIFPPPNRRLEHGP